MHRSIPTALLFRRLLLKERAPGIIALSSTSIKFRRQVHARSQHILATLTVSSSSADIQVHRNAIYSFIQFIEKNPDQRANLIADGAIQLLQKLQVTSSDQFILENCRLALALLGQAPRLPSNGIRILAIDGGGIRGIIVMELLNRLEKLTGKKFFELFDLVCGVSTGAIVIAALAGEQKMTLADGIHLYKKLAHKMFHRPSTFDLLSGTSRLVWSHAYYDTTLWESLLKKHIGHRRIVDTSKLPHCPKICCISTVVSEEKIDAHVFRNYALPPNVQSVYRGSHTHKLWQVVRASSAAPAYFGDFSLAGELHQDGGVLFNNPTSVAIHEAKLIWPTEPLQCVVSFGTGRNPNRTHSGDGTKLMNPGLLEEETSAAISSWKTKFLRILDSATDTEASHTLLSDILPSETYYRFNPYLTEWLSMVETRPEKIAQLENDAFMYYRKNEEKFEQMAAKLMEKRSVLRQVKDSILSYWYK